MMRDRIPVPLQVRAWMGLGRGPRDLLSRQKSADAPPHRLSGACEQRGTMVPSRPPRILIYSHDSYGLGHLRRCRAIAQSLAAGRSDLSILIIAGSPIIGSFSFSPNVDFIRVPGVVKIANENYQPHNPG